MRRLTSQEMILLGALACGVSAGMLARRYRPGRFAGQTVLITGGSRGLGLELARSWGREGARLAICARTADDVRAAARDLRRRGYDVVAGVCDVTQPRQVQAFVRLVVRRYGTIDVLVNNAGIIQTGPLNTMTMQDFREAMEINCWGALNMVQAVLPHMFDQASGKIVNIASVGGEISVPHLLPYSASKFALVGLSEGLHTELAADNIHVLTVCPGLMRTGSPRNAEFKGQHRAEYAWFSISDSLPLVSVSSSRAARRIVEAAYRGRAYLRLTPVASMAAVAHAIVPRLSACLLRTANGLLPGARQAGTHGHRGDESFSAWSPSILTALTERAARRNNQIAASNRP